MQLRRFDKAIDFYERAETFLVAHEAHHNLILGLCATLIHDPWRYEQPPYLATVEEQGRVVAAALMTPPHRLTLSQMSSATPLTLIAEDVYRQGYVLPGVFGPADISMRFATLWQRLSGQRYRRGMRQRVYHLERVTPVEGVPGQLKRATEADRPLLVAWFAAFSQEVGEAHDTRATERSVDARLKGSASGLYLWHDRQPVSLAGYGGPTPHGIRVGPVYTPPEHRQKGYASACVAALSQRLLDEGRAYCFLFTDLANPTSNHIYQAIGYKPVCDMDEYEFSAGER